MTVSDVVATVRGQYEDYPYPKRDPEEELTRLYLPFGGAMIEEINHYCFAGNESFDNIRILVAGGGTGDAVIHLAEQLRDKPGASIVYLDMSEASMAIAKARAEVRGLTNIEWHLDSLLNLPTMGFEPFDFINCAGVIHHLPDPQEGLRALASVLKPEGGLFLMVYATYGRHAIYHVQELYRDLLPKDATVQQRIDLARRWLDAFPEGSFMKTNLHRWEEEISTDVGFLDMLLHNQDRAYTVDEIYDLAESEGFNVVDFVGKAAAFYQLEQVVTDQQLLSSMQHKSRRERQSLAERLVSTIPIHNFYFSRKANSVATVMDEQQCVVLAMELRGRSEELLAAIVPGQTLKLNFEGRCDIQLEATEITRDIFAGIHQRLSVGQILDTICHRRPMVERASVHAEIHRIVQGFGVYSLMYLQNAALPAYGVMNYGPLQES